MIKYSSQSAPYHFCIFDAIRNDVSFFTTFLTHYCCYKAVYWFLCIYPTILLNSFYHWFYDVLWEYFFLAVDLFFTYPSLHPLSPVCSLLGNFLILFLQLCFPWASLVAQQVKNQPALQKTWVRSLGWEDPLEKGKANHSGILAWESHGQRKVPWGRKESDRTEWLSLSLSIFSFLFRIPFG